MILSSQLQAARALLGLAQKDLAEKSGVALPTLKRMESGTGPVKSTTENLWKIQSLLEEEGISFIAADEQGGPGVRLKQSVGA